MPADNAVAASNRGSEFNADRPYRLAEQVALRPEPFGGLAYHYGTRRLNLLHSPDLLALLQCLHRHPSPRAAFRSCAIANRRWPSFAAALASLAASEFLVAV